MEDREAESGLLGEGRKGAPGGPLGLLQTGATLFARARRMGPLESAAVYLVLAVVPAAALAVSLDGEIRRGLREAARRYDASLPRLRVEGGRAIVEGEEPAIFPRPGSKEAEDLGSKFVVIFDTTGAIERIPARYEGGLLITSDLLVLKGSRGQVREVPLKEVNDLLGDFVLDGQAIREEVLPWAGAASLAIACLLFVYTLLAKGFQAALLGITAVVSTSGPGRLSYLEGVRVSLWALVPAVLFQLVGILIGLPRSPSNMIYLAGAVGLTVTGARWAARAAAPEVQATPLPSGCRDRAGLLQ